MFDVHTHFIGEGIQPPDGRAAAQGWPRLTRREFDAEVWQNGRVVRVVPPGAWDPTARLADMDRLGVSVHAVMPTPFTFLYDAEPGVALDFTCAQNDALSAFVKVAPERLVGLGGLPLASPEAAVAEVARISALPGLRGVEIGTHAGSLLLHDAELDPVFAELERRDLPVFVHPWKPVAPERTAHHGLAFGLARALETELAVGSLVFGGVLDRHPRLRICLAHAGAGIPALRGRLENGWRRQPREDRHPALPPREAFATLWADGLAYDALALALAEDTFGPDHLMVGSDYPFAAQEATPGASFAAAAKLSILGSEWRQRTERNALQFLGAQALSLSPSGSRHERTHQR